MVVGRDPSTISPSLLTPASSSSWQSRSAAASFPINPIRLACPPRAATLAATFPAPPTFTLSERTATTGTGASGEMRDTVPHMYSSSITSPKIRTRHRGNRAI